MHMRVWFIVTLVALAYARYRNWAWPNRRRPENYRDRHSFQAVTQSGRTPLAVAVFLARSTRQLPMSQALMAVAGARTL